MGSAGCLASLRALAAGACLLLLRQWGSAVCRQYRSYMVPCGLSFEEAQHLGWAKPVWSIWMSQMVMA